MRLIPLARAAVIAVAISASAIGTAAYAQACGTGDHFLSMLESRGINADPESAFELVDAVCSGFAEGEAYDVLIGQGVAETGLTHDDFVFFVEQSVLFFCPESTPNLPT